MAGLAKLTAEQRKLLETTENLPVLERDAVKETAARLYGQGIPRAKIARALVDHLVPNNRDRPLEQRLSQARNRLRRWETQESFRDMVYARAIVDLDMSTPQILVGIAKKARRGRVDAARLALELTGRHNPKGNEAQPTTVNVIVAGIPRPEVQAVGADAEADVVHEEED